MVTFPGMGLITPFDAEGALDISCGLGAFPALTAGAYFAATFAAAVFAFTTGFTVLRTKLFGLDAAGLAFMEEPVEVALLPETVFTDFLTTGLIFFALDAELLALATAFGRAVADRKSTRLNSSH